MHHSNYSVGISNREIHIFSNCHDMNLCALPKIKRKLESKQHPSASGENKSLPCSQNPLDTEGPSLTTWGHLVKLSTLTKSSPCFQGGPCHSFEKPLMWQVHEFPFLVKEFAPCFDWGASCWSLSLQRPTPQHCFSLKSPAWPAHPVGY